MNKIKSFALKHGAKIAGAISAVGMSIIALSARADTAADISTIANTVGTSFETNSVALLTVILPFVVVVSILFLAAKLALRWMKKSAH